MSLAADAHEGLADDAIQTFASQRALQQAVHYVRKIKGAADADKSPAELILVCLTSCDCPPARTPGYRDTD